MTPKNLTYEKVYNAALELFSYDRDKTNSWWMTKLEELDNLAPYEVVKIGKARRLMRFITKCML